MRKGAFLLAVLTTRILMKSGIESPASMNTHSLTVAYAEKKDIQDGIMRKYHPDLIVEQDESDHEVPDGGQTQVHAERHEPAHTPPKKPRKDKNGGNSNFKTVPPNRRPNHPPEVAGNG